MKLPLALVTAAVVGSATVAVAQYPQSAYTGYGAQAPAMPASATRSPTSARQLPPNVRTRPFGFIPRTAPASQPVYNLAARQVAPTANSAVAPRRNPTVAIQPTRTAAALKPRSPYITMAQAPGAMAATPTPLMPAPVPTPRVTPFTPVPAVDPYDPGPSQPGPLPGWTNPAGGLAGMPPDPGVNMGAGGAAGGAPMAGGAVGGGPIVDDGGAAGGMGGAGGCSNVGVGKCTHYPFTKRCCLWPFYCPPWTSTGDMPQHMPYFPTAHGYYYFRPYNVIHVLQQQEMARRWGLDPRNPYDNRFFEKIYEAVETGQQQPEALQSQTQEPATVRMQGAYSYPR